MKTFSITDIGQKRVVNQDFVYCNENPVGSFPNLFIVADGMGGHNAGDFASKFCVENFVHFIGTLTSNTIIGNIEDAVRKTNELLIEKAKEQSELEGMGTTFVMASVFEDTAYVANIGDSRLYLINDKIKQVTEDHSLVEEMVKNGEIKREEARFHPNKNIITRALGASNTVVADYFEININAGDIILLCSDGLSNMLGDSEIFNIINMNRDNIETATKTLVEKANENGGKDNIAIVMIQI